jgi:NADH-quinone oxidoreductase subunit E
MKNEDQNIVFSESSLDLVNRIIRKYPEGKQKSALLPVLHLAQAEFGGWLSPEVMEYVASLLKIQPIEVFEVASFYSMYNLKPVGNCVIEICRTGPCAMNGAAEIVAHLEEKLGIKSGETTSDGKFTIKTVECLAGCGDGPVIQVGKDFYYNMTIEKADKLLEHITKEKINSHLNPYK